VKFVGANTTKACNGAKGKNVVVAPESKGGNCPEGGSSVEVETEPATKEYVCNGQEGSPWTAGGTLPPGATETGAWSIRGPVGNAFTSISFPIPMAVNGQKAKALVYFGNGEEAEIEEEPEPGKIVTHPTKFRERCPGSVLNPTVANAGNLCIYYSQISNGQGQEPGFGEAEFASFFTASFQVTTGNQGYSTTGAILKFALPAAGGFGSGSYAIKGCSTSLPVGDPDKCP